MPELLIEEPFIIGRLSKLLPERAVELRRAFRDVSNAHPSDEVWWAGDIYTFTLDLPQEVSLLPHLINGMARALRSGISFGFPRRQVTYRTEKQLQRVRKAVAKFVPDIEALEVMLHDAAADADSIAAARMLCVLHPKSERRFGQRRKDLVRLPHGKVRPWLFRSSVLCVQVIALRDEPSAESVMGYLLDASRENYVGRAILEDQLGAWRERSYTPVNRHKVEEEWLLGRL